MTILAVVAEVCAGMGATCTSPIFALGQGRRCPCLDESADGGQLLDTPCSGLGRGVLANERGMIKTFGCKID